MKIFIQIIRKYFYILLVIAVALLSIWKTYNSRSEKITSTVYSVPLAKPNFDEKNADSQLYVRDEILASLGFTVEQDVHARVAITNSLADDLSFQELQVLTQFLLNRRSPTFNESEHAYFFHALCNKLQNFSSIRKTFAETLYQVALDSQQDSITRDYALQHLRRVWEKSSDLSWLRDSIESSFWNLVEKEPAISASALLSLHTLGMNTSPVANFTSADVASIQFLPRLELILSHAPNHDSISQRMVAVRIVGDRKISDFSDHLLQILENEKEHMLVRTASISALRKLGKKEQLALLSSKYGNNHRLTQAIQFALR